MNTKTYNETQKLRGKVENKLSFMMTDTAILDLIDEKKIAISVAGAFSEPEDALHPLLFVASMPTAEGMMVEYGPTVRIAVLSLLSQI